MSDLPGGYIDEELASSDDESIADDHDIGPDGHRREYRVEDVATFDPADLEQFYHMEVIGHQSSRKLKTGVTICRVQFSDIFEQLSIEATWTVLSLVLNAVLDKLKTEADDSNIPKVARLTISDRGGVMDQPISWRVLSGLCDRPDAIIVATSKTTLSLQTGIDLDFTTVNLPDGLGTKRNKYKKLYGNFASRKIINFNEWMTKKYKTIFDPDVKRCCLAVASIIGSKIAGCLPASTTIVHTIASNEQVYKLAERLTRQSGLDPCKSASIADVDKMQRSAFPRYRFVIYSTDGGILGEPIHSTQFCGKGRTIYLCLHDGHYYLIMNIRSFHLANYFCEKCLRKRKNPIHFCPAGCQICGSPDCNGDSSVTHRLSVWKDYMECKNCCVKFISKFCYENHFKTQQCRYYALCQDCGRNVRRKDLKPPDKHHCQSSYCTQCKKWYLQKEANAHICYVETGKSKNEPCSVKIAYDFETYRADQTGNHSVYQATWQNMNTGEYQFTYGLNALDEFIEWLLNFCCEQARIKPGCVFYAFAHNAAKFDARFVLQSLFKLKMMPIITDRKNRIIRLSLKQFNLVFLDSYSYLNIKLSAFGKCFGFDKELQKGYFPYLFVTQDRLYYVGQPGFYPPLIYFGTELMSTGEAAALEQWHRNQVDRYETEKLVFDLKNESLKYGKIDTKILVRGLQHLEYEFREQFDGQSPFWLGSTLTSAINTIFRGKYLGATDMIVLDDNKNLEGPTRHSKIADLWLQWRAEQDKIKIITSHNPNMRGEFKVYLEPKLFCYADGFCKETNTIFSFQGCFYHGHLTSDHPWSSRTKHPLYREITYGTLNTRTTQRLAALKKKGYNVVTIYECEFRHELKNNRELQRFAKDANMFTRPIKLRNALIGGRTELFKHIATECEDLEIKAKDIISLYPAIQNSKSFICGPPDKHIWGIDAKRMSLVELKRYVGVVLATVAPPNNGKVGYLPYRTNRNQLLSFPLCGTCAEIMNTKLCDHVGSERHLTYEWYIEELVRACEEASYELVCIHDGLLWTKTKKIFAELINKLIKTKVHASGFPVNVKTDADKDNYIKRFEDHTGILLEKDKIIKNDAKRTISKTNLNSLWGYLGLRTDNNIKHIVCSDRKEVINLLTNPHYEVTHFRLLDHDTVHIGYKSTSNTYHVPPNFVNCIVAGQVTSYARMMLMDYMKAVDFNSLIYCDTDSLYYFAPRAGPDLIESGDLLGQMSDELSADEELVTFYGTGSKCYLYLVRNARTNTYRRVAKIRGITNNCANSQKLTEIQYQEVILNDEAVIEELRSFSIKIDVDKNALFSTILQRRFRRVNRKRILLDDRIDTVSLGSKDHIF